MLALRNAVCNDRWAEAWARIAAELRRQQRVRLRAKRCRRRARLAPSPAAAHPWRRYGQPLNPAPRGR